MQPGVLHKDYKASFYYSLTAKWNRDSGEEQGEEKQR